MKCISLWQPWAQLMVIGAKKIETRSWPTDHRGSLLIHAGTKATKGQIEICHEEPFRSALRQSGIARWQDLPLGAVIGRVELVDCLRMTESDEGPGTMVPPPGAERRFGIYAPGRFGWVTEKAQHFAKPIPYRGLQRIFNIHPEALGFT